ERRGSATNLLRIALAMHQYKEDQGAFPPAAICDEQGKPLLSWRVALLPYLDEGLLHMQFRLDQPWDSAHNKKLLEKMPDVCGDAADKTYYQVVTGEGTVFEGTKGIANIPDGDSTTLLVVEAAAAVPWTAPRDLTYARGKPLPKFGGVFKDGFHMALA